MAETADVWILLLNWKNAKDTIECMQSIINAEDQTIKGVVICDNGSNDGSLEKIKSSMKSSSEAFWDVLYRDTKFSGKGVSYDVSPPFLVLLDNGFNYGFAGGNNIGLDFIKQYTDYDYVFVLNNDTLIESDTVSTSIKHFATNEKMGLCGSKVIYEHSRHLVQAYGGARYNRLLGRAVNIGSMSPSVDDVNEAQVESKLDYILGAAMMISRPCLETIGNMEDQYFLFYEEIDWATRARRAGFCLGFAKDSIVFHKEGASIGSSYDKAKRSLLADFYLVSSRIKFTQKFYPYFLPTVYAFCVFQAVRSLLKMEVKRFKVIIQALFQIPFK